MFEIAINLEHGHLIDFARFSLKISFLLALKYFKIFSSSVSYNDSSSVCSSRKCV